MQNSEPKFNLFKVKAVRNTVLAFLATVIVLISFYFVLNQIFADTFILNATVRNAFYSYYLLFSFIILVIFVSVGIGLYRQVFSPLPKVLKRIQDIKNYQRDNESEDYFSSLPDFWNLIEDEVLSVAKTVGRRQKQSERIRKTIEGILDVFPEPTMIVDQDSRIQYFNKAFKKIFVSSDQLNDLYLHDIFRDPHMLSFMQGHLQTGTIKQEVQLPTIKSESKKYFMLYKTPFATKSDETKLGENLRDQMIIFHDITSAKKADIMKTDFVSNVSHELRTPVMSIQGYVQTLKEDLKDKNYDHVEKYFEIIESHVERLTYLINDLLELSYLESEVTMDKKEVMLKEITQKVIKQFSLDLSKGSYQINEIYSHDMMMGEPRLLEQVLINFIQNTLRYTPEKTQIHIEWKKDDDYVILIFKDNGPGISEEHLSRIFERFYRIDPHRSRTRGGTGLGLSIVKHITQRHGGSVEVNSRLGHGLEFKCYFPI